MIFTLFALMATLKPVTFPERPIAAELRRGERTCAKHRSLESVYAEDRQVVGKWFDGRIHRDVSETIWLSPSLVSRWLGYLNAREKWSYAELMGRWQVMRRRLDGKITFIAQLSALPKHDPLELSDDVEGNFGDATDVRFLVTHRQPLPAVPESHIEDGFALTRYEPSVQRLAVFRAYDWRSLFAVKWYRLSAEFEPLMPEFEGRWCPDPYRPAFGDQVSAVYLVQAPLPELPILASEMQLRIFSSRREVVARFGLRR